MLAPKNWVNRFSPQPYSDQSKILPGFYVQLGANFREDKRTIFYAGLRVMDQKVMTSYTSIYNVTVNPNGELDPDGFVVSNKTHMPYLSFPLLLKKNIITRPNFKFVFATGLAPGLLLSGLSTYSNHFGPFLSLNYEGGFVFEKKLNNGQSLGLKFPMFSYSILKSHYSYSENGYIIKQYNYSLGLGFMITLGDKIPISERPEKKTKTKPEKKTGEKPKNFSFEFEFTPVLSKQKLVLDSSENSGNYWDAKTPHYFSYNRSATPGFYFQAGINFRENKYLRYYFGLRVFDQFTKVTTLPTSELGLSPELETIHYFLSDFESVHMIYLGAPILIKQSFSKKDKFRIALELGAIPSILFYDTSLKSYGKGKFLAIPIEATISVAKKLKSGSWFGIKPTFNYSLTPNTTRNHILQYNYSFGLGFSLRLPQ